ncbi:MAG: tetratricopeptide repeat protein [Chlorobi bacterium]|nr:tetratricopeptide repeat protein [Chlorobiota bacterium]
MNHPTKQLHSKRVKYIIFYLFATLLILLPGFNSFSQVKKLEPSDLKRFSVKCKILELNNVTIKLISDGDVLQNLKYNKNDIFGLRMSWNFNYLLEFSHTGFVTQKISISSIVPENYDRTKTGVFDLGSVQLFKEMKGLSLDFYNRPIANVEFDKQSDKFIFTYDYRNDLSNAIKTFKENEEKYKEALKNGYTFFNNKDYDSALESYKKANELKPDESFPQEKINEINDLIELKEKNKKLNAPPANQKSENKEIENENNEKSDKAVSQVSDIENQSTTLDSDLEQLKTFKDNENSDKKSELLNSIGDKYYAVKKLNKALEFYFQALKLKRELNDKKGTSEILNNIAEVALDSGMYERSIEEYNESLNILRNLNDKPAMTKVLFRLGNIYESTYRLSDAINTYNTALSINMEVNNKSQANVLLNSLGRIYLKRGNYEEAIKYFNKTIDFDKETGNEAFISNTLNNIGIAYYNMGKYDKAIENYNKSLTIANKLGNNKEASVTLNNIGNINYDWKKYTSALEYYEKSLKLKKELDYKRGVALSLYNIGNVHKNLKEYEDALKYYEQSNAISKEINYMDVISKNYLSFSSIYSLLGQYEKALKYYKLYTKSVFSLAEEEAKGQVSEMLERFEIAKTSSEKEITALKGELLRQKLLSKFEKDRNVKELKIKNLEIEKKVQQVNNQRKLIIIFVVGFIILLVFVILLINLIKQKTVANKKLAGQKDKISAQNKEITDSIKYAERIQLALLPDKNSLNDISEHFIFFRPKDIVSGDFYWTAKKGNNIIVAAVDCTGHGVPGAFMSMLGISFLNEIVNKNKILSASDILSQLRGQVIKSLHQSGEKEGARDGMDMALCIINKSKMEIEYAGAFNPLYLVRNKELTVYKADKMPIGIHALVKPSEFKLNKIKVKKNDCLFLFSDGYMDQFGGRDGKKFMSKRFKQLLTDNSEKSMEEQKQILESTFKDWKLDADQIDDVLVIGLKI